MNLESRILASQPTIPWVTTCKLADLNSVFLSVKWGQFPLTSTDFKGIQEDDSLPPNQQLWNFLCSNHTIVSFSSQSTIISFCDYFRIWAAESHCWRLVQGCLSPGFLSHTPSCLVLAEERRRIFQSIKAESLDAAQENNIAKACWWLSQSQPSRLPHNTECETT